MSYDSDASCDSDCGWEREGYDVISYANQLSGGGCDQGSCGRRSRNDSSCRSPGGGRSSGRRSSKGNVLGRSPGSNVALAVSSMLPRGYGSFLSTMGSAVLPFDPAMLENIILTISDKFDFRVVFQNGRARKAMLLTAGLTMAGSLIGHRCGGKLGAAVGGAVGGACGLGIVALSMREVWNDIKPQLACLYDIVYDYLAGLGLDDYRKAAMFITKNAGVSTQLASVIMNVASDTLGKKIVSNLTSACC